MDAAELVDVDYEPLDAAVDMEAALASDAPLQFESIGSNIVMGMQTGREDALDGADVVVRGRFENQRVAVVPMEGSAIAVVPNDGDFDLVVHLACQMPHMIHGVLAGSLGIDAERLRVIAPNVGGSFGAKHISSEGVVTAKLAMELGRPVKWVETRSENMIALAHGRGQVQYVELGLKRDGTIVGMRCRFIGDGGAYAGFGGILVVAQTKTMAQGVYHDPADRVRRRGGGHAAPRRWARTAVRGGRRQPRSSSASSTWAPTSWAWTPRSCGARTSSSPTSSRYTTLMGANYDSGDYELALDEACRVADYPALLAEQAERRARGDRMQLGIGMSVYVEVTGGGAEFAEVEVHDDGRVTVKAGTSAHGQGHATAFTQIVADQLGMPMEQITYVQSDTALVARGGGTVAPARCSSVAPRCCRRRSSSSRRRRCSPRAARGRTAKTSWSSATAASASRACRARRSSGRCWHAPRPSAAARSWCQPTPSATSQGHPRSRSARTSRSSRSTPRPAGSSASRHIAVDDCGASEPAARRGPGARRARPGRRAGAVGADGLRRRRQPAHVHARRTTRSRARPSCRRT